MAGRWSMGRGPCRVPCTRGEMNNARIRVNIQQPALPEYRIPFFRALAAVSGFDVKVFYGTEPALPNASPSGFDATLVAQHTLAIGEQSVIWHTPQLTLA